MQQIRRTCRVQPWSGAVQTQPSEVAATKLLSNPPWQRPRQKWFIKVTEQWCDLINCPPYATDTPSVNRALPDWLSRRLPWQKFNWDSGKTKQTCGSQGQALFGNQKADPTEISNKMLRRYILLLILWFTLIKISSSSNKLQALLQFNMFIDNFILFYFDDQCLAFFSSDALPDL